MIHANKVGIRTPTMLAKKLAKKLVETERSPGQEERHSKSSRAFSLSSFQVRMAVLIAVRILISKLLLEFGLNKTLLIEYSVRRCLIDSVFGNRSSVRPSYTAGLFGLGRREGESASHR